QACPKDCIVCGGVAAGYNYEAPSCLPCRTFFSRMVRQKRHFIGCSKGSMCNKEESSRPCRSCRLDRCLRGGMNPLAVGGLKNTDANPVVQSFY
ncbi:hypothetical protein PENTCL1PPCAC_15104, partial [Pristionchus entomophagus]